MYRSKQRDRQVSSELEREVDGLVTHLAKHLSFVLFMSSWAFTRASSLRTEDMTASLRELRSLEESADEVELPPPKMEDIVAVAVTFYRFFF